MSIKINNISLGLDEEEHELIAKAAKKLRLSEDKIQSMNILKESVDARKKDNIRFNYSLEVTAENEEKIVERLMDKDVQLYKADEKEELVLRRQETRIKACCCRHGSGRNVCRP